MERAAEDTSADHELAQRAIAGDALALAAFEHRFRPEVRHVALRLGVRDDTDEIVHLVLTRMLVGSADRPARLASYRGEGSLRSWVRAVATRFMIDHLRSTRVHAPFARLDDDDVMRSAGIEGDVDARRFAEIVKTATESAFAELSPRQRNLLRHATFHRLGIDELAVLYQVHRATAARWLQRTREALQDAIAGKIAQATRMPSTEARSVLRLAGADADISLRRVLESTMESERED